MSLAERPGSSLTSVLKSLTESMLKVVAAAVLNRRNACSYELLRH